MSNFLRYIPLLPILLLGCSKTPDTGGESLPVFSISGQTNAGTFNLQGGVDSVYLFTDYSLDSAGFLQLKGVFSKVYCPSFECPGTLAFLLKLKKEQTLTDVSNLPYLNQTIPGSTYQTLTVTPSDTANHEYTIHAVGATSVNAPVSVNIFNTESKEISINALDKTNQVKSTGVLHYLPAYPDSCKTVRLYAKVQANQVLLEAESSGHNLNFTWSNGASNTAAVTMPYDQNQAYAITVTNTDAGCTAAASLSNLPESTGNAYVKATTFDVTNSGFLNGAEQTGITIEWVNNGGVRFSSANTSQQSGSFFTISSVEPYNENENGQPTVRIQIKFQCIMVPSGGSGLEPFTMTGNGVIGVARPN